MATLPGSTSKTSQINSTTLFLDSCRKFSLQKAPSSTSFKLLSNQSPLPSFPPNFPQSKRIPNTPFIINGFRFSGPFSISYFLSHFHSNHYQGLSPNWSRGLIYCSHITAHLLARYLNVSELFIVPLNLGESVQIDGFQVTFIDSNHCPGAVQILVKIHGTLGERYVHTCDMRFSESMKFESVLREFVNADSVFLDSTYCNPNFIFPSHDESIEYIVKTINRIRVDNVGSNRVLFLVSAYVLGKEKILIAISNRCDCLVYVDSRKMAILGALGFAERGGFNFTMDDSASDVHVVGWNVLGETWPYFQPDFTNIKKIMTEKGYSRAVGFVPTGWVYEARRDGFSVHRRPDDSLEIHLVPYSEHSSYDELKEYMKFLRPKHIVPIVGFNVEKLNSRHARTMKKHFEGLVDEMANKCKFLKKFDPAIQNADCLADQRDQQGGLDVVNSEVVVKPNTLIQSDARPKHILPIVGFDVEKHDSGHTRTTKKHFVGSVDEMANKRKFLKEFYPSTQNADCLADQKDQQDGIDVDSEVAMEPNTLIQSDARAISDSLSSHKQKTSDSNIQSDEGTQENMKELCSYLPTWVTPDQILNLLARSDGDIVEAVSDFYENETELHEQALSHKLPKSIEISNAMPTAGSERNLIHGSGPPLKLESASYVQTVEGTPPAGLISTLSQPKKLPNLKNKISSKLKGPRVEHRQKKRGKLHSSSEFSACKQSTITKFFGKVEHDAPQGDCKQSKITNFFGKTVPGDAPQVGGIGGSMEEQCQNSQDIVTRYV